MDRLGSGSRGALVGTGAPSYKGFRFPVEIISHCVWLYYRFPLSFGVQRILERNPAPELVFAGQRALSTCSVVRVVGSCMSIAGVECLDP
jgi:hypothetical protein